MKDGVGGRRDHYSSCASRGALAAREVAAKDLVNFAAAAHESVNLGATQGQWEIK